MGCGIWGPGFRAWGLESGVWGAGLECGVWGVEFGVQGVPHPSRCAQSSLGASLGRAVYTTPQSKACSPHAPQPEGSLVGLGECWTPPLHTPKPAGRGHQPSLCRYLEITPIPLTDPQEFKYQWGPRAEKEISKKDVLNAVAKVRPCWGRHLWVFWGAPGLNLMPPPPFFSHSDTRQGPHILVKPVQRGRGHPLTPQNKGTPLVCSPPISMLSAWLYKV